MLSFDQKLQVVGLLGIAGICEFAIRCWYMVCIFGWAISICSASIIDVGSNLTGKKRSAAGCFVAVASDRATVNQDRLIPGHDGCNIAMSLLRTGNLVTYSGNRLAVNIRKRRTADHHATVRGTITNNDNRLGHNAQNQK